MFFILLCSKRLNTILLITFLCLKEEQNLEALKQAGFLDIVHKPFDVSTLAQAVRRALDLD